MRARSLPLLALLPGLLACGTPRSPPDAQPDGTIQISATSLAAGVGYSWGSGTLDFGGTSHPVTMDGLLVGAVGISSVTASGRVYNLEKLEDFDGNYTPVRGGATVGEGGPAVAMRNQNGVEVRMVARTEGVTLTIGPSGVKLALKK